jgi:hypothetical protein
MFKGVKIHLKSASHVLSENDILGLHENLNLDITMKREEINMFIETQCERLGKQSGFMTQPNQVHQISAY